MMLLKQTIFIRNKAIILQKFVMHGKCRIPIMIVYETTPYLRTIATNTDGQSYICVDYRTYIMHSALAL